MAGGTITAITIAIITVEIFLTLTKEACESGPLFLFVESVIPRHAKREPGISRFPDVQLHI